MSIMRKANVQHWQKFLQDNGVDQELAIEWAFFARSNIQLQSIAVGPNDTPIGSTRLGGLPDLPAEMSWPTRPAYEFAREPNA